VLVDGRRLPSPRDGAAPDTNAIPSLLVDRVEVVTAGASAAYGSNALAGVVQFALKKEVKGLQLTAQSGISDRGDASSKFAGFAWGTKLGDRLRFLVGGEYADEGSAGTELGRSWGAREVGLLSLPATRAAGTPAQLFANGVRYNDLSSGGLITSGPLRGTTFLGGEQTGKFDFGTLSGGTFMTGSTSNVGVSPFAYQDLRVPTRRGSVLGRVTADLGGSLEAWGEFGYNFLRVNSTSGTLYLRENNIIVPIDNPYLPTSVRNAMLANGLTRITIGRSNDEIGPVVARNRTDEYRGAVGVRGDLGGGWKFDSFAQWGHVDYLYNATNEVFTANYNAALYAVRDASGNIVCGNPATNPNLPAAQRALVQSGCVPFNPFGLGAPSAAALDYVTGDEQLPNSTNLYQGAVNVTGNLLTLPAGSVAVAFGGEIRREDTAVTQSPFTGQFNVGNLRSYSGQVTVKEGYFEATVPIFRDLPVFHRLDINGAVRYADYSSFGGSTTWKVGGIWEPFDGVRLRATRSHDLRAPTLGDLFKPGFNVNTIIRNPATNVSATVGTVNANNATLGPEIGDTFTAGVVLTPRTLVPNLSLSADYYNIRVANGITSFAPQTVVNLCYLNNLQQFCALVTPDATNPTGIGSVKAQPVNAAAIRTRGVDVEGNYRVPLLGVGLPGSLSLTGTLNYVDRFTTDLPGAPTQQGLYYTLPRWRYNARVQYSSDPFDVYVQMIGFGSTRYSQTVIGPEDSGYNPSSSQSISSNRFPAYAYFNLGMTVRVRPRFEFFANVDNLFDRDPPGNVFYNTANVYDLIGRRYRAGVRVKL
jgi:outer membrane receptor protein involved in Fe transport